MTKGITILCDRKHCSRSGLNKCGEWQCWAIPNFKDGRCLSYTCERMQLVRMNEIEDNIKYSGCRWCSVESKYCKYKRMWED